MRTMRPNDDLSCPEALDLLEPCLDGDLSAGEADRLRVHLESCTACAAELALAERVQRELRSLPQPDCPPEVIERVVRAGRGEVVPFPSRERTWRQRIAAVAAVLMLAVGGGSLFVHLQHQRLQDQRERQVAQATREARFALAYLGKATHRIGLDVRDEVLQKRLVIPTTRSASQSLSDLPSEPRKEF
jgi:anti-sigma factor (TIGR02949 family)